MSKRKAEKSPQSDLSPIIKATSPLALMMGFHSSVYISSFLCFSKGSYTAAMTLLTSDVQTVILLHEQAEICQKPLGF